MIRNLPACLRLVVAAVITACWLSVPGAMPAAAQQDSTAAINGTVTDSAGAVIGGATVTVKNKETGLERRVQTNENGDYYIAPLIPGQYTVTIEQSGFKKYVLEELTLNVADRRLVNVTMQTGGTEEVVTVTSEPVINNSPTGQALISGTQIVELPLNNRNFLKLTELVAGVSSSLDDESAFGLTSRADISINGMRRNSVNTFVDGVSNTDAGSNITLLSIPTVDSIKEFKVLTSNYTAEVGRSGGGAITIVTRGGGKDFHGSAYHFLRNDALNANNFFNNRLGRRADGSEIQPKPPLRYNNWGATFSGPVILPGYTRRDKTFFFFSYEERRISRGQSTGTNSIVPSAAQKNGDFSGNLGLPLFRNAANGTTIGTTPTAFPLLVTDTRGQEIQAREGMVFRGDGRAFAGNIIPTGDISPLARSLLGLWPNPNAGTNTFTFSPVSTNDTRQFAIRIDHNFNDTHKIFGRFTRDLSRTGEPGGLFNGTVALPGIATTVTNTPGYVFAVSLTSIFNPNLVNEATYNYSSNAIASSVVGRGRRSDYPGSERIPEAFPENNVGSIPVLTFSGLGAVSGQGVTQEYNNNYKNNVIRDTLTWTRGNHVLKFGAELSFEFKNEPAFTNTNGNFAFNATGTRLTLGTTATAPGVTQTGNAFADFLLGKAFSYSEAELDRRFNQRFGRREFFAQDTWRIKPSFTLDYGVRYQYFVPLTDANNVLTTFDPALFSRSQIPQCANAACSTFVRGTGSETNGIFIAGQNGNSTRVVEPQRNNFSPRIGFAWSPFKDNKTVVRAGYGFYYDQILSGIFLQNQAVNPPFNQSVTFTGAGTNPLVGTGITLATPTGGTLNPLGVRNLIATAPNLQTPSTQQWSLAVEREIFPNAVVTVSYVGTKGDHLLRQLNLNFPQVADVNRLGAANINLARPFLGYGTINYRETSARQRYHGLLTSFSYRFKSGFTITSNYTYSKNLADATNDRDAIDEPQNSANKNVEYAEARTSRRHIFNASYVYELPFFKRSDNRFLRLALGGWQISGITELASGQPIPRVTNDILGGIRGNRPNVTGDINGGLAGQNDTTGLPYLFNPAAFTAPASGTYGDSSRSFAFLFGRNQTNLSFVKNFYFNKESSRYLQFRAEGFNIFNKTQFTGVGSTVEITSNFGRPTGTRLPREFQFALKLYL